MRFGGPLVFCAALWAAAASAQGIVDPTPDPKDTTDWDLALEEDAAGDPLPVVSGLDTPTGLVFVGTRENEEMLVLEKNSGRVRHFKNRLEQPADALDLGVDNCGERGLIAIALHPEFDRTTPDSSDPSAPQKDWVYLSYHSDTLAGGGAGSCDASATTFRVARFTWNGSDLVAPVELYHKDLTAGETTLVGGGIGVSQEIVLDNGVLGFVELLYIAIGSLGHDGPLQNNEDVPRDFDDTSVVLRLNATDGSTPANPFDVDPEVDAIEDRYFAYGFRDAKAVLVDRFSSVVWLSERSNAGFDEIGPILLGANGGFSDYKGPQNKSTLPKPYDSDDLPNPLYLLVDLLTFEKNDEILNASTYENPAFSFESPGLHPTGLAFGGTEVGPQHREDLFVGTEDGQLFRFNVNGDRQSFALGLPLADRVANLGAAEDDPETEDIDETDPDALTQILIANGFGAISDLEAGIDGSMYVVDQTNGTIHRIFYDARRDLAAASVKAPTKISLSAKKMTVSKAIKVTLVNQGEVAERIQSETADDEATPDVDEGADDLQLRLANLLGLEISSPSGCATPVSQVIVPKYARSPYVSVVGIAPNGGRLALQVNVQWACASPSPAGVTDFETTLSLDMGAIGIVEKDEDKADNVCPRPPDPDPDSDPLTEDPDPGCGAKTATGELGGDIVTDITLK